MKIVSTKPGHDGHICYLNNGKLEFSIESEKDSGPRYSPTTPSTLFHSFKYLDGIPDVMAISGWGSNFNKGVRNIEGGYFGLNTNSIISRKQNFLGKEIEFFSSSHERAHIMGAIGMSQFPIGQECYVLVWEGKIGAFYHVNENINIVKIGTVLERPGYKYAFLYGLANPDQTNTSKTQDAGKLMALCSYGKEGKVNFEEEKVIERLLALNSHKVEFMDGKELTAYPNFNKEDFSDSAFYNVGLRDQGFTNLAKKLSDKIFGLYLQYAKRNLPKKIPLLISGGCGLNCEWNSRWVESGLFEDVFIPPCPNDSGVAIGTAIDALFYHTGQAKIQWNVYAGEEFVEDVSQFNGFTVRRYDSMEVAEFIFSGKIIAWVQGKSEIGPRALGNRSLLAAPFLSSTSDKLNKIKQRESFRPIAPIVIEEDVHLHFANDGPSPYMLHFQKVIDENLRAITHVDGSARMQSVNFSQNEHIYRLLQAFKRVSGYGVLCNTSLNFKGKGFINRMSDLIHYTLSRKLDGFVVGDFFYIRNRIS